MSGPSRSSSLTPCRSPTPEPPIVQPDHFYGSEGIQFPPSPKSDGKTWLDPNDDPNASRGIPVFKPTMDQFRDFEAYMEKINCWGQRSGIVKVIPPKEWTESLPSIKPQLKDVKIKSPIEQIMLGNGGLFRQQNMEKRKTMSVREWVELCNQEGYRAPAVHEVGLEGRNRAPQPSAPRTRKGKKKEDSHPDLVPPIPDEHSNPKSSAVPSPPGSDGPGSPRVESTSSSSALDCKGTDAPKRKDPSQKTRRIPQSREARQANLEERAAKDEEFVETFDPETDWLPPNTLASDYTPEFCQKLERHYWRNCGLVSKAPWYGADTQGTLYTDETTVWNVGKLHSALDRLLPASSKGLPGVNTPYLYFGMWRATFAWHVEDMDLYSINYIHFGAPKFWYAVPQSKAVALEHAMRTYFPKDTSQCHQFLRHKSFLASPTTLAKSACRPNHLVQHAGEFVITYPRGYHAGFNLGINCAESVNFALDCWLEIGRAAKICQCVSDSVRIDVDQLLRDREEEAKAAEEALESEPAPQTKAKRSHKKKPTVVEPRSSPSKQEDRVLPTLKISAKKRKVEEEELPKLKKIKLKPSPQKKPITLGITLPPSSSLASSSSSKPVMLKIPRLTEPQAYPCCLCVSMDKQGLLPVHNPPVNRKDACDAASNPKVWMAHELCAKIIPETWVDDFDSGNGEKSKMVFGVDAIVKDRWNLKCSACTRARPKGHGAPVQCTKGKCPKAFHVMCAANVAENSTTFTVVKEVEKEVLIVDTSAQTTDFAPTHMQVDGVTYIQQQPVQERVLKVIRKLEVQILCAQHNPAVAAQKKANKLEKLRQELAALPPDSRIRIRVASGVFEVSLIRVIEETCSVEVWWNHVKREFKWGSVVFGNTDIPAPQKGQNGAGSAAPIGMLEPYGSVAGSSSVPVPIYSPVNGATAEIPNGAQNQQHHAATSTTTTTAASNAASSSSLPSSSSTPAPHPTTTLPGPQPYAYAQHQPHHQSGTQVPYEYWQYAAQQMPYGYAQTYPYQYPAYYSGATPYASGSTYNMYAYAPHVHPQVIGLPPTTQPHYRSGALQWQRPYQGPSQTNPGTPASGSGTSTPAYAPSTSTAVHQPSRAPSSAQSQSLATDGQVGPGGSTSLTHATQTNSIPAASATPVDRSVSTQPSSGRPETRTEASIPVDGPGMERANVVGNVGPSASGSGSDKATTPSEAASSSHNPAIQTPNCSSSTSTLPIIVPSQPPSTSSKIGAADLAALAQLPPEQLTEILSSNPSLREGILNALNINSVLTPGGTQSYSLG